MNRLEGLSDAASEQGHARPPAVAYFRPLYPVAVIIPHSPRARQARIDAGLSKPALDSQPRMALASRTDIDGCRLVSGTASQPRSGRRSRFRGPDLRCQGSELDSPRSYDLVVPLFVIRYFS